MFKKEYENPYIVLFLKSGGNLTKSGYHPPFLSDKRYSLPILPGDEGFKAQSLGSGGGIHLVMSPNAYTQVLTGKPFYAIVKL